LKKNCDPLGGGGGSPECFSSVEFSNRSETPEKEKRLGFFLVCQFGLNCLNLWERLAKLWKPENREKQTLAGWAHKISLCSLFVSITLSTPTSKTKKNPL
jgi:hypothetical protein